MVNSGMNKRKLILVLLTSYSSFLSIFTPYKFQVNNWHFFLMVTEGSFESDDDYYQRVSSEDTRSLSLGAGNRHQE